MEIQEFKERIMQIGAALKMDVSFPSDEDMHWRKYAHLTKDQQDIGISNGDYQNEHKLHISGCFPRTIKGESGRYSGGSIEINVSSSKTPEQVARDIERRFLPGYLPELEKAIEQVEKTNLYHQKRTENIQKMADYFGVKIEEDGNRRDASIYVYDVVKGLGSRIEAQGEDSIKFELEVTPEQAIKVFDLLKQE